MQWPDRLYGGLPVVAGDGRHQGELHLWRFVPGPEPGHVMEISHWWSPEEVTMNMGVGGDTLAEWEHWYTLGRTSAKNPREGCPGPNHQFLSVWWKLDWLSWWFSWRCPGDCKKRDSRRSLWRQLENENYLNIICVLDCNNKCKFHLNFKCKFDIGCFWVLAKPNFNQWGECDALQS